MLKSYNFKWLFPLICALSFQYSFAQNPCTPTISITNIGSNSLCNASELDFTSYITNAGTNPSYQWQYSENGVWKSAKAFPSSTSSYSETIYGYNSSMVRFRLQITTSSPCTNIEVFYSNIRDIYIYPHLSTPTITISADTNAFCNNLPVPITVVTDGDISTLLFNYGLSTTKNDNGSYFINSGIKDGEQLFADIDMTSPFSPLCTYSRKRSNTIIFNKSTCPVTAIDNVVIDNSTSSLKTIYNLQGIEVSKDYKGLVIYKYADGTTQKIVQE